MSAVLEAITGPMFSGKTEELIRRLVRADIAEQRCVVFKPSIDDRYSETEIVSHSGAKIHCILLQETETIIEYIVSLNTKPDVVGIDEVQFLDHTYISEIDRLLRDGMRVIVAGLATNYKDEPFGSMGTLLAKADEISVMHAICFRCKSEYASKVVRVGNHPDTEVIVGGKGMYRSLCRKCYNIHVDD